MTTSITILGCTESTHLSESHTSPIAEPVNSEEVTAPENSDGLQYQGVYQAEDVIFKRDYYFLRFYPDGTVIGVSLNGPSSPENMKNFLDLEFEGAARGQHKLEGRQLSFSTLENGGLRKVDYKGSVEGNMLRLTSHAPGNVTQSWEFSFLAW